MVMAVVGQRCAHSPHRMQRSSSLTMADRSAGSRSRSRAAVASSGDTASRSKLTSFRHTVGHTSTHPPHRMQRSPSKMVLMPQSRQPAGFGQSLLLAVSNLNQHIGFLQTLFRGQRWYVLTRAPLVVFFAVIMLDGEMEL